MNTNNELDSPYLIGELFSNEIDEEWVARASALASESPFQSAFELLDTPEIDELEPVEDTILSEDEELPGDKECRACVHDPNLREPCRIRTTVDAPWRWICKVSVAERGDLNAGGATGVLITDRHVLTSAHVVETAAADPRSSLVVTPALNNGVRPFGRCRVEKVRIPENYRAQEYKMSWDYALLTLAEPVGKKAFRSLGNKPLCYWGHPSCGSETIFAALHATVLVDQCAVTAGYPLSKNGEQLWSAGGRVHRVTPGHRTMLFDASISQGQSGSPVWIARDRRFHLVGVVVRSIRVKDKKATIAVRVTVDVIREIATWIGQDGYKLPMGPTRGKVVKELYDATESSLEAWEDPGDVESPLQSLAEFTDDGDSLEDHERHDLEPPFSARDLEYATLSESEDGPAATKQPVVSKGPLRIKSSANVPYRWVCNVALLRRGVVESRGTGVLIADRHVLTAAHVVDMATTEPGEYSVRVTPGLNVSNRSVVEPFGNYGVRKIRVPRNYQRGLKEAKDPHDAWGWDYALLTLHTPVGKEGFAALGNNSLAYWGHPNSGLGAAVTSLPANGAGNQWAVTAGYPRNKGGQQLWSAGGLLAQVKEGARTITFAGPTGEGWSGAPVYLKRPAENPSEMPFKSERCLIAIAVRAHGAEGKIGATTAVRITPDFLNQIVTWILEDGDKPKWRMSCPPTPKTRTSRELEEQSDHSTDTELDAEWLEESPEPYDEEDLSAADNSHEPESPVFEQLESAVFTPGAPVKKNFDDGKYSFRVVPVTSYIHPDTPADMKFRSCSYDFQVSAAFPVELKSKVTPPTFPFRLTFEYNGHDLRNIGVQAFPYRGLLGPGGRFTIDFYGKPYSDPSDSVAGVVLDISGNYQIGQIPDLDFPGIGQTVEFNGSLSVWADGKVSLKVSDDNGKGFVRHGKITGGCATIQPPDRKISSTVVYFSTGSPDVPDSERDKLHTWWNGLPGTVKERIQAGQLPVVLHGYASTTGKAKSNQELSQMRAEAVQQVLTGDTSADADFQIFPHGEDRAMQKGESREERRVFVYVSE